MSRKIHSPQGYSLHGGCFVYIIARLGITMFRLLISLLVFCTIIGPPAGQGAEGVQGESRDADNAVILPENLYDSFSFNKEYAPFISTGLYMGGPSFFVVYGVSTWGWKFDGGFAWNPETCFGEKAVHGAADKFGHLYAAYLVKRMATFLFGASGSSRFRANIKGAVFSEIVMLGSEIGDGFSPDYGFDPYDVAFNNIGILLGLLLDSYPLLDRIFAIQIEYIPTPKMRKKFRIGNYHDLPTDYGGTKFILAAKLSGIPYVSLSPLRYLNFDLGYYSRGYDDEEYDSMTRNMYLGISCNLSIAFGDLLPAGYISSTMQTAFNYIHIPWDYEAKRRVMSSTKD